MRFLAGRAILVLLLAWLAAPASAQGREPFEAAVTQHRAEGAALGNVWSCPTSGNSNSDDCGVTYRYYSDDAGGNGAINATVDGDLTPGTYTFIPAIEVEYRDSADSTPMESTFFSANGPMIYVDDTDCVGDGVDRPNANPCSGM